MPRQPGSATSLFGGVDIKGYIERLESKADQEIAYTLPDGTAVTSTHLNKVLESMFCPSLMGSELDGVHQRAYRLGFFLHNVK